MRPRRLFVPLQRVVAITVMAGLLLAVAAPALAASPEPSQDTPFSSRALSKALADAPASAKAAKAETPAKRAAKTQAAKPGFFQTRTGILVLSAFAVGTGFALYSAQNDRIHGAAR